MPDSIRSFDADVSQLAVGKAGKNGALKIIFQNDNTGRTIIGEQFSQVPLHIQRVLYYEACPDLAYLYVVSASGGILQGDRYRMDITVKKDAKAHMTTQGATRIYGMNSNSATQIINITLQEGAYLEFMPDQIIPYRDSRYYQRVNLDVHDTATVVYSEVVMPGRMAMGESFEYDVCYLKTKAANQNGLLRLVDIANMEPKRQKPESFGILGNNTIHGSMYILARKENVAKLYDSASRIIAGHAGVSGGASVTRNNSGLLVRMLGNDTDVTKSLMAKIARHVRKTCVDLPFPEIRKN